MTITLPAPILEERVVAVARRLDADSVVRLADALAKGGLSVLEVTVEGPTGVAAIEALAGSGLTIGAGTVTTVELAEASVGAGAQFLVSPHLDPALIAWASRQGVPFVPGGFTPTEIWSAWATGVPAVKVFPATTGGMPHVKSLLGPYPELALIPTGGVNASNAAEFLACGAVAVGVGGWLTGSGDPGLIAERARQLREVV